MNSQGTQIVSPRYDSIEEASKDYVIISRKNKYGVLDSQGISTIPMIYDDLIYGESNNLFVGKKTGKWEDINLSY